VVAAEPCLAAGFAAAMAALGPFEPHPALAVAVSGGADSLALAILAAAWARRHDGTVVAMVVDHALRPESANEAELTVKRLTHLGITATRLVLSGLKHGSALAERARNARYDALTNACREAAILHLLLGHHAADQTETVAMRVLRDSQTHGLAGMSALVETPTMRLLRPLLGIEPRRLRSFLIARGVRWVEDPSNADMRALRPRLRQGLAAGASGETGLRQAIEAVGTLRSREEREIAAELASRASIRPEGFAVLSPGRIGSAALSALIRTIAGARYPASPARINALAAQPRSMTLAGVRIIPAGRYADGWLIGREEAAVMDPMVARPNAIWDHRFRLIGPVRNGATIGKLGVDAVRFRGMSDLPSIILRTLPAIRVGGILAAVPHLDHAEGAHTAATQMLFTPSQPVAGACFVTPSHAKSQGDGS
jgi:tRNA(Ile)-lysidine synthase